MFIEVPALNQQSGWSCICVLWVSNLPLSTIYRLEFGMFQQCGISVFRFITGSISMYMCGRSIDFC
jgi:hypothetical protein